VLGALLHARRKSRSKGDAWPSATRRSDIVPIERNIGVAAKVQSSPVQYSRDARGAAGVRTFRVVNTTAGRALLSEILPHGLSFSSLNQDRPRRLFPRRSLVRAARRIWKGNVVLPTTHVHGLPIFTRAGDRSAWRMGGRNRSHDPGRGRARSEEIQDSTPPFRSRHQRRTLQQVVTSGPRTNDQCPRP